MARPLTLERDISLPRLGQCLSFKSALPNPRRLEWAKEAPPLQECQVNRAPRGSGQSGGLTDLTLGWGGDAPMHQSPRVGTPSFPPPHPHPLP